MHSFRTAWLATLGTALCVGCSPLQQGLPYAPIFNTGARATIISPGQNAPLMPGQHAPGTPGAAYPTSQSGSYSGWSRCAAAGLAAVRVRLALRQPERHLDDRRAPSPWIRATSGVRATR